MGYADRTVWFLSAEPPEPYQTTRRLKPDRCDKMLQMANAHGLQQAQHTYGIGVGGILRHIERHLDMALRSKVINLIGLDFINDADERRRVGHIGPMQIDEALLLHVAHPLVEIKMLNTSGVER